MNATLIEKVLTVAAGAPPFLKGRWYLSFFSRALRHLASPGTQIETNLGISSRYRVLLPYLDALLLFGRPELYRGERGALYLARSLFARSTAFVDIGAHNGYFIFYVRETEDKKPVFFFEPNPTLYECICENLKKNKIENVRGYQTAIGSAVGQAELYLPSETSLCGSIKQGFTDAQSVVKVPQITFDHFAASNNLSGLCVKVDIESAEFEFLEGAVAESSRIDFLIIEILGPAKQKSFVTEVSTRFGMHAYYINDFSIEYSRKGEFRYVSPEYNWLFCRLAPDDLRKVLEGTPFRVEG